MVSWEKYTLRLFFLSSTKKNNKDVDHSEGVFEATKHGYSLFILG